MKTVRFDGEGNGSLSVILFLVSDICFKICGDVMKSQNKYMNIECSTTAPMFGLIGVLVGGLIGNRLALGREKANRINSFVGRLSELKSLAEKIEDGNFAEWFAKSQVAIERECGTVESAISWRRCARFRAARTKYANTQRKDIQDFDNSTLSIPRIMTCNAGRALAKSLFQEMIDCVSNRDSES
jgi:hypothetical protein